MDDTPRRTPKVLAEVNITPLIDVMLVLLIIFMLVTPLASRGIDLALPQAARTSVPEAPPLAIVLVLESATDGTSLATVNRVPVAMSDLHTRLLRVFETRSDKTLFVRVAGGLRYGQAVAAMDVAKGAGVERIGLLGRDDSIGNE